MLSLESLPPEVFAQIFLYLRATDLLALHRTSAHLRAMLGPSFWKKRLVNFCSAALYPCIREERFKWMSATLEREKFMRLFAYDRRNALHYSGLSAASIVVDAMHIPKVAPDVLLVGDRGRTLSTFVLEFPVDQDGIPFLSCKLTNKDFQSHSGWIWAIDSYDKTVISGSWDGSLRSWSLSNAGLVPLLKSSFNAAVLCSLFLGPHTVAVGLPTRQACVVDLRAPSTSSAPCGLRLPHKNAVLSLAGLVDDGTNGLPVVDGGCGEDLDNGWCLSTNTAFSSLSSSLSSLVVEMGDSSADNVTSDDVLERLNTLMELQQPGLLHTPISKQEDRAGKKISPPTTCCISPSVATLFTGSSDHFLYGWDLRQYRAPVVQYQFDSHPRRISLLPTGELWVAEPPNRIHLFDARPGRLDHLYVNDLNGWSRGFGSLVATSGCILACGLHGTVEAFHPTCPLVPMSATPTAIKMDSQPTCLAVCDDVMAVGCGDGSIHLWTSPERARNRALT